MASSPTSHGPRTGARALFCLALVAAACSGAQSPSPIVSPTPFPPPPPPLPSPTMEPSPGAASCPIGKGTVDTSCARHSPVHLEDVEDAIEALIRQRPEIFNLSDRDAGGEPRVVNVPQYYAGVVANLQAAGFCANFDGAEVQVKKTNELSEQYDVLVSEGFVRRGAGSYRLSCAPANFPLDPEDIIASVRVAFFGIRCLDGRTPPPNGLGQLPVDCVGFVTATPKTKDNRDVDPRVHGPNIDWLLSAGAEFVRVEDVPGQAFNKNVTGRAPGHFSLCAVVKSVEGCLHGEVIR